MATELLATKIRVPPQTQHLLGRARLLDALETGLPRHKLTLVSAPAGYGKTTLLAQWARTSRMPVAWLALDPEDNDRERFLRYLVSAWAEIDPGIRDMTLGILLSAAEPDVDAALAAFVNAGAAVGKHTAFVLDDVHLLDDPGVIGALAFLLDHLPPLLHVVLAGRDELPLPLARYRARRELLQLDASDLRFAPEETRAFLAGPMGLTLDDDEIARLQTRLEGWIAGLQLAALAARRHPDAPGPLAVTGRHRFIADYLEEDVLADLPAGVRGFLLATSILDPLCASLCDAVTGRDDGDRMLRTLERRNLFLMPVDDDREWFRYHALFAEVLREALRRQDGAEIADLHRRAARWYIDHRLPEPAFDHAVAGDDATLAYLLLDRYVSDFINTGQLGILHRWVDALPPAWTVRSPAFGLAQVALLLATGAYEESIRRIDDIERRLADTGESDTTWQMAWVSAVRCFIACFGNDVPGAESYADQALRLLGDQNAGLRADVFHALADTYRRNGRWDEAERFYRKVMEVAHQPALHARWVHIYGALADLELMRGRLRVAFTYWRKALASIEDPHNWGMMDLPVAGWVYVRMGQVLYERNDLPGAREHLARGMARADLGDDVRSRIAAAVIQARLELTEGDIDAATATVERVRTEVEQASFPDWVARFARCEVECWLARGEHATAVAWATETLAGETGHGWPERELLDLAVARALIAAGDAPALARASSLLARLRDAAATEGREGIRIEASALLALACQRRGDTAAALMALEEALRLAEPEGYIRLFVDLGQPMARLLQEARTRRVQPTYVATLLAAFGEDVAALSAGAEALPEPLSHREQDVLRLIAAGLTNSEIAGALFNSPETVKKHTGSIYGKLGVGNRTEAAARARSLHLLDD